MLSISAVCEWLLHLLNVRVHEFFIEKNVRMTSLCFYRICQQHIINFRLHSHQHKKHILTGAIFDQLFTTLTKTTLFQAIFVNHYSFFGFTLRGKVKQKES